MARPLMYQSHVKLLLPHTWHCPIWHLRCLASLAPSPSSCSWARAFFLPSPFPRLRRRRHREASKRASNTSFAAGRIPSSRRPRPLALAPFFRSSFRPSGSSSYRLAAYLAPFRLPRQRGHGCFSCGRFPTKKKGNKAPPKKRRRKIPRASGALLLDFIHCPCHIHLHDPGTSQAVAPQDQKSGRALTEFDDHPLEAGWPPAAAGSFFSFFLSRLPEALSQEANEAS